MSLSLAVVMDPIESITPYKDTTLAMLLAAQARGWQCFVMHPNDLFVAEQAVQSHRREVRVFDDNDHWFEVVGEDTVPLASHDMVLMRKDPPFDMNFIFTTYLLERAALEGTLVSNRPASLRDVNEKLSTLAYPELTPPTLVTSQIELLRNFIHEYEDVIVKPLDGMGGMGIFRLTPNDPNISMVLGTATMGETVPIMAQRFVPEIVDGDKRILLVAGVPAPFALARIPLAGETRGNLAAGGRGVPIPLTDRDREIAASVAPMLLEKGLDFVGLDVIGRYLTEINVTSPTCAREIDAHMHSLPDTPEPDSNGYKRGIADDYFDALERQLAEQRS